MRFFSIILCLFFAWGAPAETMNGGDRAAEFEARMAGQKYAAGGIRSTVAATRAASDDELRIRVRGFLDEMLAQGTTTVEIKSGYGLDVATERRLVRLAAEGLGHHVPKGYIYFAMAFSLAVEMLNLRMRKNLAKPVKLHESLEHELLD